MQLKIVSSAESPTGHRELTVDQSAKNEKLFKQEEPMELMHSMGFTGVSEYFPFIVTFQSC